jgi:hypothetical protein
MLGPIPLLVLVQLVLASGLSLSPPRPLWRGTGSPAARSRLAVCSEGSGNTNVLSEAERLLAEYDRGHQATAKSDGAQGLGGALTANEWGLTMPRPPLADAVRRLRDAAVQADGRIMLGFCADDAAAGIAALKAWVTALELPRGVLHGMDRDGVPIDMSTFGSVYIKYNSHSTASDAPGTAVLSGYAGDFRGVYYNPQLPDGEFRQYAVLPADLFVLDDGDAAKRPSAAPSAATAATATAAAADAAANDPSLARARACAQAAREALQPLQAALAELGAVAVVEGASAEGVVRLRYAGPLKLRRSVEMALRSAPGVSLVELVEAARAVGEESGLVSSAAGGARSRRDGGEGAAGSEAGASADGEAAARVQASPAVPTRFASGGKRFISQPVPSPDASPAAVLHARGWVILRRGGDERRLLDADTLAAVRSSKFEPIFNGHAPGEAPLRFMGRNFGWASTLEGIFTEALAAEGLLACSDGERVKTVNDCYALRSLPCVDPEEEEEEEEEGAEERAARMGRQPAHSDSPMAEEGCPALEELADADMPLSVLLAIQPGTKLWVFPRGCGDEESAFLARVEVGDIMVWRGDLVHAGAGYAEEHVRVHAYVDPPAEIYKRPFGKTNRCAVEA